MDALAFSLEGNAPRSVRMISRRSFNFSEDPFCDGIAVEAVRLVQFLLCSVFDECIGPAKRNDTAVRIGQMGRDGFTDASGEDIVLKSAGTQFYSYTYVADAVSGLLTVLLRERAEKPTTLRTRPPISSYGTLRL